MRFDLRKFFENYNFGQSIWLIMPIFLLLPGTNTLGFLLALLFSFILIFAYKVRPSKETFKIAVLLLIFAVLRIFFSKDFLSFANIKTSVGFVGFILFALTIARFKNKFVYYSLLIFPFVFLSVSFLLTYFFAPNLLLERKILDSPLFQITEWGPSFVFFNLALISCSFYFMHFKKYLLLILAQIALFIAMFYGVRAIIPLLILSATYYCYLYKFNLKTLCVLSIQAFLLVCYYFTSPILISHLSSNSSAVTFSQPHGIDVTPNINLPPILRKWESPRTTMVKEVLTKNFLLKNFFGGKNTIFTHPDFVNNSHNYFVDTYWNHGFISTVFLLIAIILFFFNQPKSLNIFIFLGHFLALNLNLTPPWYIIIFFTFLILSKDFESELA